MRLTNRDKRELSRDVERLHAKDAVYSNASTVDAIRWLLVALLVMLAVRLFVFDNIVVIGPSMEPTYFEGEHVFAEKLTYYTTPPRRGDVVIAYYPPEIEKERVIKRVIGLPGETVEVRAGLVYIDGQPLDESAYWTDLIYTEVGPVKVPAKHVFLIGDNRNHSMDSRDVRIGPVPYWRLSALVRWQWRW